VSSKLTIRAEKSEGKNVRVSLRVRERLDNR
jgi:hypothetical protein